MLRNTQERRKEKTIRAIALFEKRLTIPDDDIKLKAKRFRKRVEAGEDISPDEMIKYKKDVNKQIEKMRQAHGISRPNKKKSEPKKESKRPIQHR